MNAETRAKLDELKEIILAGDLPDDRIAGVAGVTVEDVAAYRAESTVTVVVEPAEPKKPVKGKGGPLRVPTLTPSELPTDKGVLELARAAQDLIDQHGYVLKNGKLKPPRDPAAARFLDVAESTAPFLIRLLVKLITKHVVQGKVVDASFQPSIYRGDMARLIVRAAEREGRPDIIEILES